MTVYLADYRPFSHLVSQVDLTFVLSPGATRVQARLTLAPNPAAGPGQDLRLDGEGLRLMALALDGRGLDCQPDATGLTIPAVLLPAGGFTLETEVEIAPEGNTALEGLYMSGGIYCTQCEAEGFRKITFYPDRPDVMARFRVRIESAMPVLLSNGNPVAQGAGWAEWDDPWPKPAYLFALVAGDLVALAHGILARGPKVVFITEGAAGARAVTAAQDRFVAATPVVVADTVGAGDTFNAGVLAALHEAGALTKAALVALPDAVLDAALTLGTRAAAVTVSRAGANPPWRNDL